MRKTAGGQVLHPCVQVRQGGGGDGLEITVQVGGEVVRVLQQDCEEDCWGTGATPL